jgi:ADP-ribosyl-[dinitrogen reductase] hydrolase
MALDADEQVLDRALGAYLGLALGDALGATVEFMQPREIVHQYGLHQQIIGGGWLKLRAGEVTDDTTMSLALGEALLQGERCGRPLDVGLIAESFAAWWRARPVDCGNTCRRGIQRYLADGSLEGPYNAGDAGNGALMRCLPAVLATLGSEPAFKRLATAQARITHHHPLSDAAVLGIGQLLRALLRGEPREAQLERIEAFVQSVPAFRFSPYPGLASGYVVDTVQTVLHFFSRHEDFRAAVVGAVNRGDDADTTGAIVGMLAGARCGARALPADWLARLQPAVRSVITEQTRALLALNRRAL